MTRSALWLILASVTLTAFAQILLKVGMSGTTIQRELAGGFSHRAAIAVFLDPRVLAGLALYFGAAMVWLIVLSKVEVSLAYPFVAIGFVLTAVIGRIFLNEGLSIERVGGTVLISLGVILLARA